MPPTKWYVNLDSTEKRRAGYMIELVATRKFGHGLKRTGRRQVDWNLEEDSAHPDDAHYVPTMARARLAETRTLEDSDGEFHNILNIPALGGRTYTVTATKHSGADNVRFNKQYESWRRVYYSIHCMDERCRRLFKSVEQQIKDIFAEVHIELKRRHMSSCIVDEEFTSCTGDPWLSRTYDGPELDRAPHHLRAVLVRNLVSEDGVDVHWTMDATTSTGSHKQIGISSQGLNHSVVVYRNSVTTIDEQEPFESLRVHVHSATVAVPEVCIARDNAHQLTIDLTADLSTEAVANAIDGGATANLTATLTGIRCDAGFHHGDEHPIQAEIRRTTLAANPLEVGSAQVWIADDGTSAWIRDPNIVLAELGPADNLQITLADGTDLNPPLDDIAREDDHTLRISLTRDQRVSTALTNDEAILIDVRRHGVLGQGAVTRGNYDFNLREFRRYHESTRQRVAVRVAGDGDGQRLQITTPWLWLDADNPVTMNLDTLGAPIDVPAHAIAVASPQQLEIDLAADPALEPAAAAMAGDGKITFAGRLRGLHTLGGYSLTGLQNLGSGFIALTAHTCSTDEDEAVTARRIKLIFCHELGHALKLAWKKVFNYTERREENNDRYYTDEYGGCGSHCSHNAALQPSGAAHGRESTASGEIYVRAGAGELCIMYHTMDLSNMGDDFCDSCKAHLRRAKVRFQ